ncbi:MAG TPA: hypothetical protein VGC24_06545 [Burkholderiaceae bacterium]
MMRLPVRLSRDCGALPRWRQRGALAVETALVLPVLVAMGLIGADMQRIHLERIRLESTTGVLAVNLVAQPKLTAEGLDELVETAMQNHASDQQLYILTVKRSGKVTWALQRGGATSLCEAPSAGGLYTGTLPEDTVEDEDDTNTIAGAVSMLVVRACRKTSDITLFSKLTIPDLLETDTVFPATHNTITLDSTLQTESDASGMAYSDSDS